MPLQKNDTVIIISPAGRVLDENIDNAVSVLENWGLKVIVSENAKKEHYNFSGTKEERFADLQWALNHPEAKAIFASRGGYGAIHLLDKIDWNDFKKNPKLLIGYSDITNLHATINKLGMASLHGLMPNSFPHQASNASLESLKKALFDATYTIDWTSPTDIEDCTIAGEIVGGNLSILYSLQGTPYAPNYKDKILFFEDVNEYLYHIDRILYNFELSGITSHIKGLIVGDFTEMQDNDVPFGKSIETIIHDIFSKHHIPMAFGLHTGHGSPTLALPLGKNATLKIKNNKCHLSF